MALFLLCDVENYSILIKSAYCEEEEYMTVLFLFDHSEQMYYFYQDFFQRCIVDYYWIWGGSSALYEWNLPSIFLLD